MLIVGLDHRGVGSVLCQHIEAGEMKICAVEKEENQLVEDRPATSASPARLEIFSSMGRKSSMVVLTEAVVSLIMEAPPGCLCVFSNSLHHKEVSYFKG
jgi:hypothetical protein